MLVDIIGVLNNGPVPNALVPAASSYHVKLLPDAVSVTEPELFTEPPVPDGAGAGKTVTSMAAEVNV